MAYVKKLTAKEFTKDIVDFMLKKYGIGYDYIISLPKTPDNSEEIDPDMEYQEGWFQRYTFDSYDEYMAYKEYFFSHWKDYAPIRDWRLSEIEREFAAFNLMYGLKTNYEIDNNTYFDEDWKNNKVVYEKFYGKKKR